MCWMCDHPRATQEDYFDVLRTKIHERGWVVQYVEDDRSPFAYTIGLHPRELPELLMTGVGRERAELVLNTVAQYCVRDAVPAAGDLITLPDDSLLEVIQVAQPDAHMGIGVGLYGPEVRALQLVWRDERGHSPWCPEFDEGRGTQPVLGVRPQNA